MDEGALLSIPNPTSTAVRERGEAAAINAMTGTVNTAANPLKIGGYIPLYATGEGRTVPADQDGRLGGAMPNNPVLPVSVTVAIVCSIRGRSSCRANQATDAAARGE